MFAGQTVIDLSIIANGRCAQPIEFLDEIKRVAESVSTLLIKPHPVEPNIRHLTPLLEQIPNAVLCRSNIYRILSDINLRHVVALSSSVLSEAALFGARAIRLIASDRDTSVLVPPLARRWYRLPSSVCGRGWLSNVLKAGLSFRSALWPQRVRIDQPFNLRRNLGGGWGLDDFYSGASLTLTKERSPGIPA
jgi:hypothetical protein